MRPKICKSAHAFLWEYSYKGLKLAQLLGQLGVFLTLITKKPFVSSRNRCSAVIPAPRFGATASKQASRVISDCHFAVKLTTLYQASYHIQWLFF